MSVNNLIDGWNYDDHKNLIFSRLNRFCLLNDCQQDKDELLIEADIAFVRVTQTWKEGEVAFSSYLALCVDRALRDFWDAWKKHPRGMGDSTSTEQLSSRREFNMPLFLGEVSQDAREAIQTALAQPNNIINPNTRKKLVKHALKDMGWTGRRIAQCWKEIREALS